MVSCSSKLKYWILAAVAAGILLWNPLDRAVFSVRLALSLQKMASGAAAPPAAVRESKALRRVNGREYEALTFRPVKSPATSAVVLVAGLSEQGCYHPRLLALSRLLAGMGVLVVAPDIREFRDFQISAEPMVQILFWFDQVPGLQGAERVRTTGLAGISYSGTLALITAARPEIRDRVGFVAAIGPYASLLRCVRNWFAASPSAPNNYFPTRFYAKWIVMRAALDMLDAPEDRNSLQGTLKSLLIRNQAPPADSVLTAEGKRWYRLATLPENESDPELTREIESYLVPRLFSQLEPQEALPGIHCPVFLIHGAYDDLIPPGESVELHRQLADSRLLISPFLTHTHPAGTPPSLSKRINASLEALVFCYHLSGVLR